MLKTLAMLKARLSALTEVFSDDGVMPICCRRSCPLRIDGDALTLLLKSVDETAEPLA